MGNCGGICANSLSKFRGDIIMDRLISENGFRSTEEKSTYNLGTVVYLQRKIKKYVRSNHPSNKILKQAKHKNKINSIEDSENNLMIIYNSNYQNKLTSAKSQTFKNSSGNFHNESSYKEKYSKQSPTLKNHNKSKHRKSAKSSIISEKIDSNNNNINSDKEVDENDNKKEIEKIIEEKKEKEEIDENPIRIEVLKAPLLDKKIFENDAFNIGTRNTKNENDPRDKKSDNIRKKYPKIEEGKYTYIGEWKNGLRDGFGSLFLENEIKFMGHFSKNKTYGYGHLWKDDGDSYKGYWNNFEAEGWGIYKSSNGACYDGEWSGDLQHGFGIEQWPRGSTYFGNYEHGYKNGIGVLNFGNKAWYEGEFKNGIICGIGSFFFEDGRRYLGMWKNNKMNGYGYIIWPNENVYKGEFKNDKKEGFGICKIKNKVFMGIWKNNVLDGKVIIVEDGKLKKQLWCHGRASQNLSNDTYIYFEKYAKKYIKNKK